MRIALLATAVAWLSACSSTKMLENDVNAQLNSNLAKLTSWKLRGKIAVIAPNERKSANLNWQQIDDRTNLTLSNVLGITLAELNYNGTIASLEADSKTYKDTSPSRLIHRITGWQVPVEPLVYWIKGASSATGRNASVNNNATILRYDNGLIKQITPNCNRCERWQINYKKYDTAYIDNQEYQLPSSITLKNLDTNISIKLRIDKWSAI